MFRLATRRVVSRRVPGMASTKSVNLTAKRMYSDPWVPDKTSSEMPWLLASVGFTVPAAAWLYQQAPTPSPDHHSDKRHNPNENGMDLDESHVEANEAKNKAVDEGSEGAESSEISLEGGLNTDVEKASSDSTRSPKEHVEDGERDKRTTDDTETINMFGGKPKVTDDTPDAEDKNTGQKHMDDGKDRHKTDITEKGPAGMPKTQETVRK